MDYEEYQRRVVARASKDWHSEQIDQWTIRDVLDHFIQQGNRLDKVKKALFYGRPYSEFFTPDKSALLPVPSVEDQQIIHAILGFATEGVELVEALFARLVQNKPFDHVNLQEEFGDGEWYRAFGLAALGQSHEDNLVQNDNKLEKRFGAVFSADKANNRDLDAERQTLEG